MNESQHPDHELLNAYAHQPDADEFRPLSLHLIACKQCRDEVTQSNRLKTSFAFLNSEHCSEEHQHVVDDYLYNEKNPLQRQRLKQQINSDPLLLKSALFGLSNRDPQAEKMQSIQTAKSHISAKGWFSVINEWLMMQTSTWTTMGITAAVTLAFAVLILQQGSFDPNTTDSVNIARYQDNDTIRFYPRDQLPGIGFFNGAMQSAQPFKNMQVSSDNNQKLELSWQPVRSASAYELSLYRFSNGEKKLLEIFKTVETRSYYQLSTEDYNQRFEWVLSGQTSDDKTFVTSGGFVVQKPSHRRDL